MNLGKGRNLLIHIGSPKTGTKGIQEYVLENSTYLKDNFEIYYPFEHVLQNDRVYRPANGSFLLPKHFSRPYVNNYLFNCFSESKNVLLSEEVLFVDYNSLSLCFLYNNKIDYNISVVCYLRDAASYICSLWAEFNKFENGMDVGSFDEFMRGNGLFRSIGALLRLVDQNPDFNFYFRPYPGIRDGGDVVNDFLTLLNVEIGSDGKNRERKNLSLSRKVADLRQLQLRNNWQYSPSLNSLTLPAIAAEIESGDDRSVIETLPDQMIEKLCLEHAPYLNHLLKISGIDYFDFSNVFPSCYCKERPPYREIDVSEYGKIQKLLKEGL
jgi:hypothetical protein